MQQLLRAPRFWGARRPLYNRGLNCSLLYAKPGSRGLHFSLLYARVDARIEVPKANSQKGVLQFTYVIQKHYSLKASFIFNFVRGFASACRSIPRCRLREVSWFQNVLCLHFKLVEGPLLAHLHIIHFYFDNMWLPLDLCL